MPPPAGDSGHHVVMHVRNAFTHDSRVEKEAHTLRHAGYRVTVICEARPNLPRREVRAGIAIQRVPRRFRRIPVLRFFSYRADFKRALEEAQPSVLHAHDTNALDPVGAVARRRGIPYVFDSHELWLGRTRHKHSRIYHRVIQLWHAFIERRYVPDAAAVLTVSAPIAEFLRTRYRISTVELVPNYPDLDADSQRRELRSLLQPDAIPADAPILLHIGLFVTDRGIEEVIRALPAIPNAHFVLLGVGPRAAQASRLAGERGVGERVHPLPHVPTDVVIGYARSATIGLAPIIGNAASYAHALPNKLFQYMAAGLPVVVSDLEQMSDVVRSADAGLVVNARDPAAIAAAVATLLADRREMERLGANGHAAVLDRYNWQVAVRPLVDAYRRIGERLQGGEDAVSQVDRSPTRSDA